MRSTVMATLVALFALTGTAQAAIVPVQSLTPPFAGTNPSVTKTPDGVHFGVYFNASLPGGIAGIRRRERHDVRVADRARIHLQLQHVRRQPARLPVPARVLGRRR